MRNGRALLAVIASMAGASTARAQASGFALDRFDPSERGSHWFSAESLDFRGN